jgi:hypothetical protein
MRTIELSPSVSREMEVVAAEAGSDMTPREIGAQLAPVLPGEVHEALIGFRQGQSDGGLLLKGVGPGEIPPEAESYSDLPVAAPLLLGLVSLIGTPVAARDEWSGLPLTDIRVTPGLEDTVSSKGKGVLPLHQESQHLHGPPDGLALLTVRGGSPTRLAPTPEVIEAVEATTGEGTIDSLRQPWYRHKMPDSYEGTGATEAGPILLGDRDAPELKVDLATTEATTEDGEAAMAALAEAAGSVATDLDLTAGTLLIFDNRRWLHGRGKVIAPSQHRWLLRSLFVYDTWRTASSDHFNGQSELAVFA